MSDPLFPLDQAPRSVRPPFDERPQAVDDDAGRWEWRPFAHDDRAEAIRDALAGVELGAYDERLIAHLASSDLPEVGGIVSWLMRVRQAGRDEATS